MEARASPYIIRTLHKDFDPVTGSSSALMQAALGSVDLPSGVTEALSSLEMLSNIDANPVLPNGTVFQKTHVKHPRQYGGANLSGATASPGVRGGTLRSTTAPSTPGSGGKGTVGALGRRTAASPGETLVIRPTMVAPRTRVSCCVNQCAPAVSAVVVAKISWFNWSLGGALTVLKFVGIWLEFHD